MRTKLRVSLLALIFTATCAYAEPDDDGFYPQVPNSIPNERARLQGDITDLADFLYIVKHSKRLSTLWGRYRIDSNSVTLAETIHLLPALLRKNVTFKHGTLVEGARGHEIERKNSQTADRFYPRAILWDEETGFSLSFNGGLRGQTGNNRIDLLWFDQKTFEYHLGALLYPVPDPNQIRLIRKDEKGVTCTSCHGPRNRPVWAMYPDWPAFYGSDNDEIVGKEDFFKTFVEQVARNPELTDYVHDETVRLNPHVKEAGLTQEDHREAHLRFRPLFELGPTHLGRWFGRGSRVAYYLEFPYRPSNAAELAHPSRAFFFRPNLRFGILYNRMNALNIHAAVTKHPNFEALKEELLYTILDCTWPAPTLLARAKENIKAKTGLELREFDGKINQLDIWKMFGLTIRDVDIRVNHNSPTYTKAESRVLAHKNNIMDVGYVELRHDYPADAHEAVDEIYPLDWRVKWKKWYFNSYFDGASTFNELVSAHFLRTWPRKTPADLKIANLYKPVSLEDKYGPKNAARLAARWGYDKKYFQAMDKMGKWIPLPFPTELTEEHHRDRLFYEDRIGQPKRPPYKPHWEKICGALAEKLHEKL